MNRHWTVDLWSTQVTGREEELWRESPDRKAGTGHAAGCWHPPTAAHPTYFPTKTVCNEVGLLYKSNMSPRFVFPHGHRPRPLGHWEWLDFLQVTIG